MGLSLAPAPSPLARSYLDGNPLLVVPPEVAALPCLSGAASAEYGPEPSGSVGASGGAAGLSSGGAPGDSQVGAEHLSP